MMPTPPLGLRNRLAEMILSALSDPDARRQLDSGDFAWLGDAAPEHAARVRARARRAAEAVAACPRLAAEPALDQVLVAAAALFDAGLHFEVHELLEPHWVRATGAERQALQGLIQVAVGFQHLANGNVDGARSLLVDGSTRLRAGRLPGLDLDRFADAAGAAESQISGAARRREVEAPPSDASDSVIVPPFPRSA